MATRSAKIDQKADLIWAIADKLTGVYKPHEYGDVILPLTVIRRFDCILSDTKDAVLQKYEEVKNLPMKDVLLRKAAEKDFYNTSKYTFERLMDDPDHIEENFRDYLNGFSANVQDILEKFKFDGHITTMANKGILYIVLKEYTTDRGNLHPNEISNLEMGYIFEEIIRRFSESHNEDAGQHYTPREVIQLMVNILFYDDNDILSGNNVAKTIYDPACGTGGMLSVAEEYLHSLNASTELVSFGQEINDQTFAICKADMLIKGNNADYIKDGNTLSDDQFAGSTFGLYKGKSIRAIGKLKKTVVAELVNGEVSYINESGEAATKEEIEKIKEAIVHAESEYGYNLKTVKHRYFIVEHFYPTDFKKASKNPIQKSKYFNLAEMFKSKTLPKTDEIASILDGKTWEEFH